MQIYLEKRQHRALKREARRAGTSMTGLVRELIDAQLLGRPRGRGRAHKNPVLSLIGLGQSGVADTSERIDEALDEALGG